MANLFRVETNPRPSKNWLRVTTEANVNNQLICNATMKDFTFVRNKMAEEAKMFQHWLRRKQEERHTPVKTTSVIQSLHAENMPPPSLEAFPQNQNLEIL
uniref:Uncharacterized protein n=1 Tax=Eutreptiella gymnastica TaxID=73025 RepID=A0A6U7XSZ9_9EUGL